MKGRVPKNSRVSQRISAELDADLRAAAAALNLKRADIIRDALIQYLRNLEKGSSAKTEEFTVHTNSSSLKDV